MVCTARRSAPPASKCVAKLCRSLCGLTFFVIPAATAYCLMRFQNPWRVIALPRLVRNTDRVGGLRPGRPHVAQVRSRCARPPRLRAGRSAACVPCRTPPRNPVSRFRSLRSRPTSSAHAKPGGVHGEEHRAIAHLARTVSGRGAQQRDDLLTIEHAGQLATQLGSVDQRGGVVRKLLFTHEEAEEAPQRAQRSGLRSCAQPGSGQLEQIGRELARAHLLQTDPFVDEIRDEAREVARVRLDRSRAQPPLHAKVDDVLVEQHVGLHQPSQSRCTLKRMPEIDVIIVSVMAGVSCVIAVAGSVI